MWKCCKYTEHFSPFNAFEYVFKLYSLNYFFLNGGFKNSCPHFVITTFEIKTTFLPFGKSRRLSPLGLQYPMSTAMSAAEYLRCSSSVRGLPVPLADQLTLMLLSGHLTKCTEWQLWKLITLKITGSCIFLPFADTFWYSTGEWNDEVNKLGARYFPLSLEQS